MIIPFAGSTPAVDDGAWLAGNATVVGDVRIDRGASVWFGAVVRADNDSIRIGPDSNIQDNCVLHADPGFPVTIGERVSVGHAAVVHGCTIESDVLIGMGATLLNGVVVGRGSLIAAGALLTEGTAIPPGSLVTGVPGKVRRALSDAEQEALRRNATDYVHLAHQYRAADTALDSAAPAG
jgi:carbonic anhydrase/acetyltransferase-like protein (isoleucine patch superfamily)